MAFLPIEIVFSLSVNSLGPGLMNQGSGPGSGPGPGTRHQALGTRHQDQARDQTHVITSCPSSAEKPSEEKKDTFVEKLATQVIKNLQVKISSIHLRYEDNVSAGPVPGPQFASRVSVP